MTPRPVGGSGWSAWRVVAAIMTLCGGLALGACTQRDTNNPFTGPSGASTEMPYGPGVKTTDSTAEERP